VKIFISYRRADAAGRAARLHDALATEYGRHNVFTDIDRIPPGSTFRDEIARAIAESDVVLVLIGRQWTTVTDPTGARRLHADDDLVRIEVETALAQGIRVIPVLLDGASIPAAADLPGSISAIAGIHALEMPDRGWTKNLKVLYRAIGPAPRRRRRVALTAVAVVAVLGGAVAWWAPGWLPERVPSGLQLVLSEDFDRDEIDSEKWVLPADPARIYPRDGVLNLVMRADGPEEGVVAHLVPRPVGPFREIEFVVRIAGFDAPGPGGAGVTVREPNGRTHRLVFGPSPPDRVEAAALVCARPRCSGFDDYTPPEIFEQLALGEQVPMKIAQDGREVVLSVHDRPVGRAPLTEPLTGFTVDLDGAGTESWHITIDSIRVYA